MIGRISVIMAAYNSAGTIEAAIQSVLRQHVPGLELIVVDDGSTDDTLAVVRGIDGPDIRVITQGNQGPAAARNRGLAASTGDCVAFIDADDVWLERKLSAQWQALCEKPRAGVAYGWANVVDEDLSFVHRDQRATHRGNVYGKLLSGNFIASGSNSMMRRSALEIVGGFDESLRAVEDWELHVRLASQFEFVSVPQVVVLYRRSGGSISADTSRMEESFLAARAKVFDAAPAEYQALEPKCTAAFYRYLATRSLQQLPASKEPIEAIRYLRVAIQQDAVGSLSLLRLLNPWGAIRLAIRKLRRGHA